MSKLSELLGLRKREQNGPDEEGKDNSDRNMSVVIASDTVTNSKDTIDTFAKPDEYSKEVRSRIDSQKAKALKKDREFGNKTVVKDKVTGDYRFRTESEAKAIYGSEYMAHTTQTDHVTPVKKIYDKYKKNPYLKEEDISKIANCDQNLTNTTAKLNNAKRDRSNTQFIKDKEYRESKGISLDGKGKRTLVGEQLKSEVATTAYAGALTVKNAVVLSAESFAEGAVYGAAIGGGISACRNAVAVIKGEKDSMEALTDTAADTVDSAVDFGITHVVSENFKLIMKNSSNEMIKTLYKTSTVPTTLAVAAIETIKSSKKYFCGEIDGTEYAKELGQTGIVTAGSTVGAVIGSAAGPVGELVGSMVGYAVSSAYYYGVVSTLEIINDNALAHEERIRIEAECDEAIAEMKRYRAEIEQVVEAYFADYEQTFSEAFKTIESGLISGNPDDVIAGGNIITQKLGGTVQYNNMKEFDDFMNDTDADFVL